LHPSRRKETSSIVIPGLQPCKRGIAKEKSRTISQRILWEDVLLQVHLTRTVLSICTASRHSKPETAGTTDRWVRRKASHAPAIDNRKFRKQV
jgi:hypothetical protein